ncbi:hypothetical protein BKA67DRAFT_564749 [Truncatella angustata]|uniref:Uncharacterized protein n=1 Tax=Truncatella angustata TaxID=152316 RepID=A0A9P8ZX14_9PEZI|nr:uncharacterized protein BKA67DRAFT_564749 [Truncatella angustata]KAH6654332.1 hypothetical protein BKA67DRAFT_564749 [Truncatella angustata]
MISTFLPDFNGNQCNSGANGANNSSGMLRLQDQFSTLWADVTNPYSKANIMCSWETFVAKDNTGLETLDRTMSGIQSDPMNRLVLFTLGDQWSWCLLRRNCNLRLAT